MRSTRYLYPEAREAWRKGPGARSARRPDSSPLAWRNNMLAFDGETLNEAIAQVSQQTGWTFELEDPALREMRVGGYVHADPKKRSSSFCRQASIWKRVIARDNASS